MPSSHSTLAHYLTEAKQANLNIQADFDQKSATLDLKKKRKKKQWGLGNEESLQKGKKTLPYVKTWFSWINSDYKQVVDQSSLPSSSLSSFSSSFSLFSSVSLFSSSSALVSSD